MRLPVNGLLVTMAWNIKRLFNLKSAVARPAAAACLKTPVMSPKPSIVAARRFKNSQKGPYRAFWLHFRRRWSEFAILENFRIFAVALTPTGC
jgi:hypothetical protein